jgi:hypothetical protein
MYYILLYLNYLSLQNPKPADRAATVQSCRYIYYASVQDLKMWIMTEIIIIIIPKE